MIGNPSEFERALFTQRACHMLAIAMAKRFGGVVKHNGLHAVAIIAGYPVDIEGLHRSFETVLSNDRCNQWIEVKASAESFQSWGQSEVTMQIAESLAEEWAGAGVNP